MAFIPSKWQCADCGFFGTLYLKTVGVTIHSQVCRIDKDNVTTSIVTQRDGRSEGYVCCACGVKVADTAEELIEQFK